jgi:hypothetical protein
MTDRQRPTVASLQERIDQLDRELGRAGRVSGFDREQAQRTARGTTRANRRAEQAHTRVDGVEGRVNSLEERTGLLETASAAFIDRLTIFAGMFRTQRADTARHEERITALETVVEDDGNIAGVWLATLLTVEAFILAAWFVMAGWRNGLDQRLDQAPSYDGLFIALAVGSAIVISVVAIIVWALRDQRTVTARSRARTSEVTQTERQDDVQVEQVVIQRRGAPVNPDDPTQAMPAVAVDETQELPAIP